MIRFETAAPLLALTLAGAVVASLANVGCANAQPVSVGGGAERASAESFRAEIERRLGLRAAGPGLRETAPGGAGGPLASLSEGALVRAALARYGREVIYGIDDRKDWHEISDPLVRSVAEASAALFSESDVETIITGLADVKTKPFHERYQLCPGEKFEHQPSGPNCSSTLIAPDLILTAGHCVREVARNPGVPAAVSIRAIFGFRVESQGGNPPSTMSQDRIYRVSGVVAGELEAGRGRDWAVLRLEQAVPSHVARPVPFDPSASVALGRGVFVVGYPSGLPLKYAPGATVRENDHPSFFVANLDTFGGNSGSGVFDQQTKSMVGVLVRGETDYVEDTEQGCRRANVCPSMGCRGEDITRVTMVRLP